ncbi:MAG: queG [Bacillota bacterium]|nr:queG [Bacillota bacterium]
MKQKIIDILNENKIDVFGFTNIMDYNYLQQMFLNRVNLGYDNEFEEYNLEKRFKVNNIFPKCKSIIAIGMPYAEGYKKQNCRDKGILSVISFGEDYHKILNKKLKIVAEQINENFKHEYLICVDTSPLIDKEICKIAGLGYYGKNSLLINEYYGSFINLGYILTDLQIETENIIIENNQSCQDCNICINSCPNNAILIEGGLNTKKCISYLTQTKSYIPLNYRNNMKNQIYGCDICQVVCPKNKEILSKEPKHNYDNLIVDLNEMIFISKDEFANKFGLTAGSWRGKNIWKRNAIISIGNLKLNNMFDKIKNELNNPSEMIKIYAAWSLLQLDEKKASDILNNSIKYEKDIIAEEYKKLLEV